MFDWLVGVGIRFTSNGVIEMQRLSGSANTLNSHLLRQQGLLTRGEYALARYRDRLREISAAQIGLGTRVALGGAAVGLGYLAYTTARAGELQKQLTLIQMATGASASQMGQLRQSAFDMSNLTAMSVVDSANVIRMMAKSGINDPKQLLKPGFMRAVAQFSDVQFGQSGTPFAESAVTAVKLAHLYQDYTPKTLMPMLNDVTKLSMMMPDSLKQYLKQSAYYVGLYHRFGVPQNETLMIGAFLDRMGMGQGKGGTSAQNFLMQMNNALNLTGHVQNARKTALMQLGLLTPSGGENPSIFRADKNGHSVVDVFRALQVINKSIDDQTKSLTGPQKAAKERSMISDMQRAFGIQGARFGLLGTPQGVNQLFAMIRKMHSMPSMGTDQANLMGTLPMQWKRAVSNVDSLAAELGSPQVSQATSMLRSLGDAVHNAQSYMHKHPGANDTWSNIVKAGTALLGLRVAVGGLAWMGKFAASFGAGSGAGGVLGWIDNVFLAGFGSKLFGTIAALLRPIPGQFATVIGSMALTVRGFAGTAVTLAASANAASGGILALAGSVAALAGVALGATSFYNKGQEYDDMAKRYGAGYANYLSRRHPGDVTFDPTRGDLTPSEFSHGNAASVVHIHQVHIHGAAAANAFLDEIRNPQHLLRTGGVNRTSPRIPAPLSVGNHAYSF